MPWRLFFYMLPLYKEGMSLFSALAWFAIASIVGILLYWHGLERRGSRAEKGKSHHSMLWQRVIRWLPILFGVFLIFQLVGIIRFDMPVPSGVKQTMFVVGLLLFWLSAALAIWARQALGNDWAHAADFQIIAGQKLVISGPYAFIRHPIYVAFLLMFVGVELVVASWLVVLALPIAWFVTWQSKKEEQLLAQAFGAAYQDYACRTSMFLPTRIAERIKRSA